MSINNNYPRDHFTPTPYRCQTAQHGAKNKYRLVASRGLMNGKKTSQIQMKIKFWPIIILRKYNKRKICEVSGCFYQIFTSKQHSIAVHTRFILSILSFGHCDMGNPNPPGRSVDFASASSILAPKGTVCVFCYFSVRWRHKATHF